MIFINFEAKETEISLNYLSTVANNFLTGNNKTARRELLFFYWEIPCNVCIGIFSIVFFCKALSALGCVNLAYYFALIRISLNPGKIFCDIQNHSCSLQVFTNIFQKVLSDYNFYYKRFFIVLIRTWKIWTCFSAGYIRNMYLTINLYMEPGTSSNIAKYMLNRMK